MYSALVNTFNHLTIRDQYEEYDEDSSSSASEDKIDETPSVVDEKENILVRANRAGVDFILITGSTLRTPGRWRTIQDVIKVGHRLETYVSRIRHFDQYYEIFHFRILIF